MSIKSFIVFCFLIFAGFAGTAAEIKPVYLKAEHLVNPMGIDNPNPRLTWQLSAAEQGILTTFYQIFVGTDAAGVAAGTGKTWNSGTVKSDKQLVIYGGEKLLPFTKYYWAVKVQTENGEWSELSDVASFETGVMDQRNWKGSWITDTYDYNLKPAPYFRKTFETAKKVVSARAYIAVAGLYELYINGQKAGNHRLDPMYTRFDRRTLYVTYDVTELIRNDKNAIGVLLGNGWYNHQSTAVWYFDKAPWRASPRFCFDLKIKFEDGSEQTISSGDDWKTATGPLVFNSIYTAEHYDARLEQPGWNLPDFDDSKWKKPLLTNASSQNITAQAMVPIRNVEELKAVDMKQLNANTWLFDFGRNIAGVSKIKVSGPAGTTLRLKHAERLAQNGFADMSNIDVHYRPTDDTDPFQTDIFILLGKGEEEFMPLFNYKGFQYVEVTTDKPVELKKESMTAYFMHSDVPPLSNLQSSNPVIDKMWKASNASYLSNLFGYPTDCPQREKNGWTGDAQINIETGLYNFDAITVYEKWLADHRDEQLPNGILPAIIPTSGWGYHWANGPDWTSTIAIIPWNIYIFYGDKKILEDNYDNLKRYVDHITSISQDGTTDWGLGDWVPVKSETPKEFTSSIYYFVDAQILAKTAALLNKPADAESYFKLAEKIKNAINKKYLNTETGIYGSGFQTELSAALKWGIVPENLVAKVAENLKKRVEADNAHLDGGLLGTKTILNALSENGYADLAYKVASQETYPSWGWWIVNGATTFYENWPLDAKSDISMNHIMFGEVNAWFFKALGGIFPDEEQPGFKNVILKPNFVSGLNQFSASHNGPYGMIVSVWKRTGKTVEYKVEIPAGSTATLFLTASEMKENGKPLAENTRISVSKTGEKGFQLQLKPGQYLFGIK